MRPENTFVKPIAALKCSPQSRLTGPLSYLSNQELPEQEGLRIQLCDSLKPVKDKSGTVLTGVIRREKAG